MINSIFSLHILIFMIVPVTSMYKYVYIFNRYINRYIYIDR